MAGATSKWELYDWLIEGVPEGIGVLDCCLGLHWSYVEAECGMGIGHTLRDGTRASSGADPRELDLKTLCSYAKSWNFTEATLGVAALNAWYAQPERIKALGGSWDEETAKGKGSNPFWSLQERCSGKKVAIIGHLPNVNAMAQVADVTVLERNCSSGIDTPDSACEYILPEQDFVIMTGTTLTNKTMPRLLELSREATVVVTGPSAVPAAAMEAAGVDIVAGSMVADPELATWAIRSYTKSVWRGGIRKFDLEFGKSQTATG